MKTKIVSVISLLLTAVAEGHYKFARVIVDGKAESSDWLTVRRTNGTYRSDPVDWPDLDVTSPDIRCYQAEKNGPQSFTTVKAGSVLGFTSEPAIFHDGPVQWYMAKLPQGSDSISTWNGGGQVWFKAAYSGHGYDSYGVTWGMNGRTSVNFTIPKNSPSGDYLIRTEQVGFNEFYPIAQIYLSCAQVRVTDGGNGAPGPLVSFPGAYKNDDPGLHYREIYPPARSYIPPGPPVWDGK